MLFSVLISLGFIASFFIVGGLFWSDYCEQDLALWNIVYGSLVAGQVFITQLFKRWFALRPKVALYTGYLFSTACLAWVIVGTVFLDKMSYYHHACQNDLYLFTLAMVIIVWIITVLSYFATLTLRLSLTQQGGGGQALTPQQLEMIEQQLTQATQALERMQREQTAAAAQRERENGNDNDARGGHDGSDDEIDRTSVVVPARGDVEGGNNNANAQDHRNDATGAGAGAGHDNADSDESVSE